MVQHRSPAGRLTRDVRSEARVVRVERRRRTNVSVIVEDAARSMPPSSLAPTFTRRRPSDAAPLVLDGSARRWASGPFRQSCGKRRRRVAQLKRLVPKIERAQTLSPEATQTISRLIERQSVVGGADDPSHRMRRKAAAIERMIDVMKAKQDNTTSGTIGRAMSD